MEKYGQDEGGSNPIRRWVPNDVSSDVRLDILEV